jgi:hypothetical protein
MLFWKKHQKSILFCDCLHFELQKDRENQNRLLKAVNFWLFIRRSLCCSISKECLWACPVHLSVIYLTGDAVICQWSYELVDTTTIWCGILHVDVITSDPSWWCHHGWCQHPTKQALYSPLMQKSVTQTTLMSPAPFAKIRGQFQQDSTWELWNTRLVH